MTLLATLLLYGAVALGFFLLIDGLGYYAENSGDRGDSRRARRLRLATPAELEAKLEAIARAESPLRRFPVDAYIDRLIEQSQTTLTRRRVYLMMGLGFSASFLALVFIAPWLPLAAQIPLAALASASLPIIYLQRLAEKRIHKFEEQFPDALDLIVRSLRVGHPLSTALQTIAGEMPEPIASEFEIAARQVRYGRTPPEAVGALAKRVGSQDVHFFSVAVQVHHEAGGNLAEILSGLSRIIRSRFQLFRKVRALTVEGRFSAWFLSLFPVVMVFAMNALQPGYYAKVADFPYFMHAIALTVTLLIVNVVAMRMITRLEV